MLIERDLDVLQTLAREAPLWETIERLFDTTARKVGMRMSTMTEATPTPFRRPTRPSAQLSLF